MGRDMNIDKTRKGKKVMCTKGRVDGTLSVTHHDKHRLTSKGSNNGKCRNHSNRF